MGDDSTSDGKSRVPFSEIYFQRAAEFRIEADKFEADEKKGLALDFKVRAYSCESQAYMAKGNLQKAYESVNEGLALYANRHGKTVLELEIQKKFLEGYIALNTYIQR